MDSDLTKNNDLNIICNNIRKNIILSLFNSGSGHPGSSLSIVEILAVIGFEFINWNSKSRERIILSKGHAAPALYSLYYELGLIRKEDLMSLRQIDSNLQGHPDRRFLKLIDAGTGALGQGLSISIGYAIANKIKKNNSRIFCIIGDGETQEGQIWEAAMFAGSNQIENLICFLDNNKLQNETFVEDTLPIGDIEAKWSSFGWNVKTIDGHDTEKIAKTIKEEHDIKRPLLIISNTIKGKGISFMENDNTWHGKAIDDLTFNLAMKELELKE